MRLLFTALVLLFLFGILAAARGDPPLTKQQYRARAALALAQAGTKADAPRYATVCPCTGRADCTCQVGLCICAPCGAGNGARVPCGCAVTGYCTCLTNGNRCECPGGVGTRTKRATDGGPDWHMGSDGYWYRELPGGYVPGPYGLGTGGGWPTYTWTGQAGGVGVGYSGAMGVFGGGRGCSGGS